MYIDLYICPCVSLSHFMYIYIHIYIYFTYTDIYVDVLYTCTYIHIYLVRRANPHNVFFYVCFLNVCETFARNDVLSTIVGGLFQRQPSTFLSHLSEDVFSRFLSDSNINPGVCYVWVSLALERRLRLKNNKQKSLNVCFTFAAPKVPFFNVCHQHYFCVCVPPSGSVWFTFVIEVCFAFIA